MYESPMPIEQLGNDGIKVLLMRRTGNDSVKTSVGYRDARGRIEGWFGARPPTHFINLPNFAKKESIYTIAARVQREEV